ncbi:hypothetical protein [Sphingomonas sp. 2378]|uniref:hypothetical protein n=1 Tax=Sphingomonas sp. 2378 TaxID=1219748 RepID=UPI00311B04E7
MARASLRHDGLQPRLQLDREGFPQGMPRKVSERIVSGLRSFIGKLVDSFGRRSAPTIYIGSCGYEPERKPLRRFDIRKHELRMFMPIAAIVVAGDRLAQLKLLQR